ncbi:MAG TPA: spherulation-specific family 4 protein [Pseudomonadales bacterium]|nr:spherulation-specific family 4 protein [Pseudomonadales bacterium]
MKASHFLKCLACFSSVLLAWMAAAAPMGILVPAYFYPPAGWDGLNFAASQVPLWVIVNPDNGPGAARDSNYAAAVNRLRAAGGRVMGYVHTAYAARDTNAVEGDIRAFFNFYPLDGIFIDEMASDANPRHYNYYAGLDQFIRMRGNNLFVMGNPGTTTQEPYLATVNALLTFENFAGYSHYTADRWVTKYPAQEFCHVIYGVTNAAAMTNDIRLAMRRNVGWIYVTDEANNPYARLPSYWTNEVNYVRSLNQADGK